MNKRNVFCALLAMALLVEPGIARARMYNANTGRFQTMDSYEGNGENPLSLHKYLYAHANPVNNSDPSGQAIYMVKHKSSFPLIDHRIIVGDTGTNYSASSYVLEFWGNDGVLFGSKYELVKNAKWHYRLSPMSAKDTIDTIIKEAGHGKIVDTVITSIDVDQKLNQEASKLDGRDGTWIAFLNDCGTGASKWLERSLMEQRRMHPYLRGRNYIHITINLGPMPAGF